MYEFVGFNSGKLLELNKNHHVKLLDSENIAILRNFPVFMGCTNAPRENDLHADMYWLRNKVTEEVFIRPIIAAEYIYLENHNEVVGKIWSEHHNKFGEFVAKHMSGKKVFEIGGAHGMASISARTRKPDIDWILQDLNPIPVPEYVGEIIKGEFNNENAKIPSSCMTIAHSHTLEHVHDQFSFMASISSALEIGARQILSWPNMDLMLKKQNLSFLNFEHTTFLPINRVLALLEATGFKVLETTYFKDHSIFIASEKVAGLKHLDVVGEPQLHEFSNYFETLSAQVKQLNQAIREFEGNIYLFGAHIFSQMLISAGLDIKKIEFVLDNAVHKQGKRLYGTSLKVESPEFLRENIKRNRESLVIAAVGEYFEEIQQQLFEISSSIKVLGMR